MNSEDMIDNGNNKQDKNIDDDDPAYTLADSFGINTGDTPSIATGETIVSAMVNNTVGKIPCLTNVLDTDQSSKKTLTQELKAKAG